MHAPEKNLLITSNNVISLPKLYRCIKSLTDWISLQSDRQFYGLVYNLAIISEYLTNANI